MTRKAIPLALALASMLILGPSAGAQEPPPQASTAAAPAAPAPSIFPSSQTALALDQGPWVLGEVLVFSGAQVASDPSYRDKVRGQRGMLYTKADIADDVEKLVSTRKFDGVEPVLFEIPGSPVPQEFASISAVPNMVRLVYRVAEKPAQAAAPQPDKPLTPPAAVSGIIISPTAYRGAGKYTTPGMGLDFNAIYFIGRLYGHNEFANSVRKTNYIDRLGVWLLSAEGKMQIQSETRWRPAMAVGAHGHLMFRDAPQPTVLTPTVSLRVDQKTTKTLSDAYVVASKNIKGVRVSAGYMMGSAGDIPAQLTEYLTPQALEFYAGRRSDRSWSRSMPFASILYLPKPAYPLGVEVVKFNGAALNPMLVNFKLGYFLKLNFDVSYLRFNGGYDVLGTFQFRYNHFPRR